MGRGHRWIATMLLVTVLLAGAARAPAAPAARAEAAAQAVVDPHLLQVLSASADPVPVIVTFWGQGAPTEAHLAVLRQVGVTAGLTFHTIPMAGIMATAGQVEALARQPEVRSLYHNRPIVWENDWATALTGVDRVRAEAEITSWNVGLPVSGKGVAVLVNDSGVDGTHKDIEYPRHLKQNVMAYLNPRAVDSMMPVVYVEDVANTDSTGGHGTHVAGIVGATGAMSGLKYEGVAPGADLIGYGSGGLALLDTLGGFDYALKNRKRYNIRVVTNSWGDPGDILADFQPDHPVNVATKLLHDQGVVTVFSAGNSGTRGDGTITGNYKKAPWVITVGAVDRNGQLGYFSSRGVAGRQGTATVDSQTWVWEDRPTVVAPGVSVVSTRVAAPVSCLGAAEDAANLEPAHLPYYTQMTGTSMAAPHVAGVVALVLEANPGLTPLQVKENLQQTATNIPGREPWETGAGLVNARAAVDMAFTARPYGRTVNLLRTFNSNSVVTTSHHAFKVTFDPVTLGSTKHSFSVPAGLTELAVRVNAKGALDSTGNPVNLVLTAPDGTRYSSNVSILFTAFADRTVSVVSPMPGAWAAEVRGMSSGGLLAAGAGLPEELNGVVTFRTVSGFSGLNDVSGHPGEEAIKLAVTERLVDGRNRKFRPDHALTRAELAEYLTMGTAIRQFLPLGGLPTFTDVGEEQQPFVEAVVAKGAALRDTFQTSGGVMRPTGPDTFSPGEAVTRTELAFALVQSLGLEAEAVSRNGSIVTAHDGESRVALEDSADIPADLRGYVQFALDLHILPAEFSTTQDPHTGAKVKKARFNPGRKLTRAEFAAEMVRFHATYWGN